MINTHLGIKTFYKFFSVNPKTLKKTALSGWSENTILTSGRNELSKRDWFTCVQIGTNSTAPNAGQTSLLGYIAGSDTVVESSNACQSEPPYYAWKRKTFRFYDTDGIANENLNEVAIGWSQTTQTSIMARALIEDINGVQVTITPLPGEWLDVLVEVRYYPPLEDVTGSFILDGVTYNYIIRAAQVTNSLLWSEYIGSKIQGYSPNNAYWYATDGDIGTIDIGPSGIVYNQDNNAIWNGAYSENSYQQVFGLTGQANAWLATTGKLMRSLRIFTTAGAYQVQFDSQSNPGYGIPKDSTWSLGTGFVIGWDEATV